LSTFVTNHDFVKSSALAKGLNRGIGDPEPMEWRFVVKLVMPGLVPGIHVLAAFKQERRGWPGRSPAMTENESFSSC
jgi:hypothetical protein